MIAALPRVRRAALGLSLLLVLAACKADLYTGLAERDANDIVGALAQEGIPANKVAAGETFTVAVDKARFPEAVAVLERRGLPGKPNPDIDTLFPDTGLVQSAAQQQARMTYAISQELSRTISEIDGVLSARVHVVLPQSDMLGRDLKPSSASVFIRYSPSANVEQYASQIKLLVANSIEGLLYDNITVVMVPAAPAETATLTGPKLVDVMGVWVHPASKARLTTIVGGLVALAAAGFIAAGWPWLSGALRGRRRPTGTAVAPFGGASAADEGDGRYGQS